MTILFHRDLTRLIQQVQAFPDDDSVWQRVGTLNSAGNLVLHLEGNLREFIGRQLGGVAYVRQRELEFSSAGITASDLVARIEATREVVGSALSGLSEAQWLAPFPEKVLGVPLTTHDFVVHLLGHLNYHLGQIDAIRRALGAGSAVSYVGL